MDISVIFECTANDFQEVLAREPTTCTSHIVSAYAQLGL